MSNIKPKKDQYAFVAKGRVFRCSSCRQRKVKSSWAFKKISAINFKAKKYRVHDKGSSSVWKTKVNPQFDRTTVLPISSSHGPTNAANQKKKRPNTAPINYLQNQPKKYRVHDKGLSSVCKTKVNPQFDRTTVLTDLAYSLCCIRKLPASLTSHKSVRTIYACKLVPESSTENFFRDTVWEKWEKSVLRTLISSTESKGPSARQEPALMDCIRKLQDGDITEDEFCDQVTKLANSIAERDWALEEADLRILLQNSAKIIRSRFKALQLSDEARDHCPAAEAWFCFMMAVWSRLRTLVSEPQDEAAKFSACMDFCKLQEEEKEAK